MADCPDSMSLAGCHPTYAVLICGLGKTGKARPEAVRCVDTLEVGPGSESEERWQITWTHKRVPLT